MVLRHAKSGYPDGVDDHARPLAPRGRRDAAAAAELLAQLDPAPELVFCSTALRAEQTWALAGAGLRTAPVLQRRARLYLAGPLDVLSLLRTVGDDVGTVVVVGHEPTMSGTTLLLAGPGSDPAALAAVGAKYPTTGTALLRPAGPWSGLAPGGAALTAFHVPRG